LRNIGKKLYIFDIFCTFAGYIMYMRRIIFVYLALWIGGTAYAINARQLADSLDQWAGFDLGCVPKVRVTNLKTRGSYVWVYTNNTLGGLSLSENQLIQLRYQVSRWVLGNSLGKVSIYSDNYELGELITDRFRPRKDNDRYPIPHAEKMKQALHGQNIALWPSHGIYYNQDEDRWKLQRATMWSTVEDVYTTAIAELTSQCLERAGATVFWARARYGRDSAATELGTSGYPRWTEGARYWLEYMGVPDSVWRPRPTEKDNPTLFSNDSIRRDYLDDLRCRGNWVNWLCDSLPITLSIALHTDGYSQPGDSTTIGTLAIYSRENRNHKTTFGNGQDRFINRDLADYVQTQIVEDIRRAYCPTWSRRQLMQAGYCETKYPEIPSLLIEILSHKQLADIQYALDPHFRRCVARAIYKGIGQWIHIQTGTNFVVQPLAVQQMRITPVDNTQLQISWVPTIDSLTPNAQADYFILQWRQNDGAWKEIETNKTEYIFTPNVGVRYDFRVIAGNDGGTSEPSETLSAYLSPSPRVATPWALIINGFNRTSGPQWFADSTYAGIVPGSYSIPDGEDGLFIGEQWEYNRALDWISDDDCGWGMCYRNQLGLRQVGNTHDYAVRHGRVLARMGISYVSTNSEAITTIDSTYAFVDLVLGKDKIGLPPYVQDYVRKGGKLIVSGAYLGTIPNASRNGVVQTAKGIYTYATYPNSQRLCAEDCHAFVSNKSQKVLARYKDSGMPACVQDGNTILWSVPLDAFENADELLQTCIEYEEITPHTGTH